MFRSKPVVRFLIPDQELGTIVEKSANVMGEVDWDDTNSLDNPRRQESKRKKSSRRMQGLQRAESIRKEEVSGEKRNFNFKVIPNFSLQRLD